MEARQGFAGIRRVAAGAVGVTGLLAIALGGERISTTQAIGIALVLVALTAAVRSTRPHTAPPSASAPRACVAAPLDGHFESRLLHAQRRFANGQGRARPDA